MRSRRCAIIGYRRIHRSRHRGARGARAPSRSRTVPGRGAGPMASPVLGPARRLARPRPSWPPAPPAPGADPPEPADPGGGRRVRGAGRGHRHRRDPGPHRLRAAHPGQRRRHPGLCAGLAPPPAGGRVHHHPEPGGLRPAGHPPGPRRRPGAGAGPGGGRRPAPRVPRFVQLAGLPGRRGRHSHQAQRQRGGTGVDQRRPPPHAPHGRRPSGAVGPDHPDLGRRGAGTGGPAGPDPGPSDRRGAAARSPARCWWSGPSSSCSGRGG